MSPPQVLGGTGSQQIVDMHDFDRLPRVDDKQCSDLRGIEQFERLTNKLVGPDGFRDSGS